MCQKIGNALRARSEAIKKALKEYNKLAVNLRPPQEQLTWASVIEMATVGDFELLRHARQDIRDRPWTRDSTRQAIRTYLNLKRSEQERARLNVEMNRLLTSLLDTHLDISIAIAKCQDAQLVTELRRQLEYHQLVSERIVGSLISASNLPEFTGCLAVGRRIGRSPYSYNSPLPSWIHAVSSTSSATNGGDPDDVDIDGLVDFFAAIEL
jgi:hypothetical protein